jgi:hypothetical protein
VRIENLRSEKDGNRARVAATVTWEDCDRPTHDIYFETDEAFGDSLSCNPDAFLIGCIVPAMHYGEKRVFIDEEICPQLRTGMITVMNWFRHWYYKSEREIVEIEAKVRTSIQHPEKKNRAGFFFSGGIDSFATLRANRINFPLEHPWSIKDGLLIYGLELDDPEAFRYVLNALSVMAKEADITLIPVYTNLYLNYRQEDAAKKFSFWSYKFQAAALSAVAHAFSRRFSVVSIASTFDIPNVTTKDGYLRPYGTHPLLDHNYSSCELQILYDGVTLSRLEKTKIIGEWDLALQHLRVCNQYKRYGPEMLNCGECEKCLRTMLMLMSIDLLPKTRAFPNNNDFESSIKKIKSIPGQYALSCYKDVITNLMIKGRYDLARTIRYFLSNIEHRNRLAIAKAAVKKFDERYLKSTITKCKRNFLP